MKETVLGLVSLISSSLLPASNTMAPFISPLSENQILVQHSLDLTKREPNPYANEVFADNILLALHFFAGEAEKFKFAPEKTGPKNIDWEKVRQPFEFSFTLLPGEVFAFHGNLAKEYQDLAVKNAGTKYFYEEGYKSVGGLAGNGVCHLASLMNWVAQEAGLTVTARVNHNFYPVEGVPKEYGTSIRYQLNGGNSQNQNLYIKNNFSFPVEFNFSVEKEKVTLQISGSGIALHLTSPAITF